MTTDLATPSPSSGTEADAVGARLFYSISEAAALLGVSRQTVWRWVRDGRLPVARLGHRTVRITREDIERLLAHKDPAGSRSWVLRGQGAGAEDNSVLARLKGNGLSTSPHIVQFYESDAYLLDRVAEFIAAALRAGDAGIVVATEAHRAGIDERLRASGLDVAEARTSGQYLSLDAAALLARFMVDGVPDPACFAEVAGGIIARAMAGTRPVRIFGEMVALLVAEGDPAAAVRLEQLWNDLQHTHAFSLLCAYPIDQLGGDDLGLLDEVCAEHAEVIPAESYTSLATPEERLRAVAALQQKEGWLDAEIRERRRAVEAQARLAAIVESSDDAIIGKTLDGMITSWNGGAERLYGYTAEEVVGRPIALLIPADRSDELPEILARLLRGERIDHYETVRRRKDGTLLEISLTVSPIRDAEGEIIGASAVARDITERRRIEAALRASEQRLRAVLEALPVGVWLTDAEGAIVLDNPAGARIWAESGAPLAAEEWSLGRTLATGEAIVGEVLDIESADGAQRTILSSTAPLVDASGRIQGAVVVNEDITTLQEVDKALREAIAARDCALAEAQAALRVREEFIGSVSHDLRTPLSIIKGLTQLLLRQAARSDALVSEQILRPLTEAERATTTMNGMVDELLDVSRLDTGRPLDLQRQPTDLVALVQQVASDHQRTTSRHRIVVECGAPTLVGSWDTGRLERVLSNLLSNAVKYSPDGGEVRVRVGPAQASDGSPDDRWVELTVQDSGIGIPSADLPSIFDRFHRATNVGGIRGAGVGLAGVKQIVEQHGGTIAVTSDEGAGATFTLRLPCEPIDEPRIERDA